MANNKSFTVLTVTKRRGWEALAVKSVAHQTVQPDHWIVVTEKKKQEVEGADVVMAPKQTQVSNLNASLNAGLRLIKTDFVVFYQDWIELQPDCFEKLLALVDSQTFVSTLTPNYDGSNDGRFTGIGEPRRCRPEEWETNVAAAPMDFLRALGGFDERLDAGWSWDNVNVAQRAAMLGARFILDESNRPKLLPHEMTSRQGLPLNGELCANIINRMRNGLESVSLNHL